MPSGDWGNDAADWPWSDDEYRAQTEKARAQAQQATEPESYPLIWLKDIQPQISQPSLIRGVIKPETMVVTYGESNSGKTFHVLDRDLSLAAGREWYGRETEAGFVLYVAAEGPHSVINRVSAYKHERLADTADIPFAVLPKAVDLLKPDADVPTLISFIRKIEDTIQKPCIKITCDTLARAMNGGNENAPDDMGRLVGNADRIRSEVGCCFEFVHHSGKDSAKGARGHSSLRAATDTEIEVTANNGTHVATVVKQRDFAIGDQFAFTLKVIELGHDQYGHAITTCVPVWVDSPGRKQPQPTRPEGVVLATIKDIAKRDKAMPPASCFQAPRPPKGGQTAVPVKKLHEVVLRSGGVSESDNTDSQRRAFNRAVKGLQTKGFIEVFDEWTWLADKRDKAGQW